MKTQISKLHTHVVAVQPLTTSRNEDRMKKHSSTALKLAAICAMTVTSTLTALASNGHCDPAPTTTMVAWYPFDEISGLTSANLATQNTGNWAPDGVLVPADGMVGGSLYFDGNTAYIDSPSSIVTNIGPATDYNSPSSCGGAYSTCQGNFSFAVWIRVSNLIPGSTYTILDKRSFNPNPYGYSFGLYKDGLGNDKIFLQLADGQGSLGYTNYISDSLPSLNGTGWHHVALTVNRSSTPGPYGITFYLDRQVKGIRLPTDRQGSLWNNSPLRIGATAASAPYPNWFSGYMDELQMWNRTLAPGEVQNIFDAGSYGVCRTP